MADWRCGHVARISCACVDGEIAILQRQLQQAQEELRQAYEQKGSLFLDAIRAKDQRDAAIERGVQAWHHYVLSELLLRGGIPVLIYKPPAEERAEAAERAYEEMRHAWYEEKNTRLIAERDAAERLALAETMRERLAEKIDALGAVVFCADDKEREMLSKPVVLTVIRNAPVAPGEAQEEGN